MIRKDFIAIAETILGMSDMNDDQQYYVAEKFADMLQDTNPQFKRDLFIQAATGVVAVNARKAV